MNNKRNQYLSRLIKITLQIITFISLAQKSDSSVDPQFQECRPTNCRNSGQVIRYPFWILGQQQNYCGFPGFNLSCRDGNPILHIPDNDYIVQQIFYHNQSLRVSNLAAAAAAAAAVTESRFLCFPQIQNLTFDGFQFRYASNVSNLTLLSDCPESLPENLLRYRIGCDGGNWGLGILGGDGNLRDGVERCGREVVAPVELHGGEDQSNNGVLAYGAVLGRGFMLRWRASECGECEVTGGRCGFNWTSLHFRCFCPDRPHSRRCAPRKGRTKIIVAAVVPGVAAVCVLCLVVFIHRHRPKWGVRSYFSSRNISSDPSSKADIEGGSGYFGVPVFSYTELGEATKNFDPSKELGDGGFGTVYFGKLRDGREVAVKRLYENNYKRVEQFMNEIEILTRLRHRNLVTLYGCTSRHSRELLLVYEYIPNGTVADHLHGDRADPNHSLPWPTRMKIAIETASALAYLHASDIIHRDVKTNNILLDNNFCVKVADFGLSRLFPNDVTHVSTAPQGTPGYVDPEYHQCYQLTDKSDVYSFGVVLIELISSMPAVDISRHRHEINLANLAVNKIQKCAFHELVDLSLGYESDESVRKMTTCVAELAFRCLQLEKEMRPTMDEVLEALREIEGGDDDGDRVLLKSSLNGNDSFQFLKSSKPPPSPESDEVMLLKNRMPPPASPDTVTHQWVSSTSTSYTSG